MAEPRPSRVLVIDDEPDILKMMMFILPKARFEVMTASGGARGLELLSGCDIVVVDYKMPEMDGFEVLKAIRSINSDLPVIVASGYIDPELRRLCGSYERVEMISKPFDLTSLRGVIDDVIKKYPVR